MLFCVRVVILLLARVVVSEVLGFWVGYEGRGVGVASRGVGAAEA